MLFKKTVYEDRQGSETNIVQSQVYAVIERLKIETKIESYKGSCLYLLKFTSTLIAATKH